MKPNLEIIKGEPGIFLEWKKALLGMPKLRLLTRGQRRRNRIYRFYLTRKTTATDKRA